MTRISQAEILVVDTSVVVNFAKAGALRPLGDCLGDRGLITQDVFGELTDWAVSLPAIGRLLRQRPWSEPIELSPELSQKVVDILGFVEGQDPAAQLRDVGEVSCVVLAQYLRDGGQERLVLLLDDVRHGKNLARVRQLDVVGTPALIVEMVTAGAMGEALGGRVWRETFSDRSKWIDYDTRLAESL